MYTGHRIMIEIKLHGILWKDLGNPKLRIDFSFEENLI